MLDAEFWMQDTRFRMQDTGYMIQDTRCRIQESGCNQVSSSFTLLIDAIGGPAEGRIQPGEVSRYSILNGSYLFPASSIQYPASDP